MVFYAQQKQGVRDGHSLQMRVAFSPRTFYNDENPKSEGHSMLIRKATARDLPDIENLYSEIHTGEECGRTAIGWIRGVYPTRATAEAALTRGDLFVQEDGGQLTGAAVINRIQVDVYAGANWRHPAQDHEVMVLHTLCILPDAGRRGLGTAFVRFYEEYALSQGSPCLRMDTNARNLAARALYRKLGYEEIGEVPCVFNGIEGVQLVLLEKKLEGKSAH